MNKENKKTVRNISTVQKSGILLVSSLCPFHHALKTHLREGAIDVHQDRHLTLTGVKPCNKSRVAQRMEQSRAVRGRLFPAQTSSHVASVFKTLCNNK